MARLRRTGGRDSRRCRSKAISMSRVRNASSPLSWSSHCSRAAAAAPLRNWSSSSTMVSSREIADSNSGLMVANSGRIRCRILARLNSSSSLFGSSWNQMLLSAQYCRVWLRVKLSSGRTMLSRAAGIPVKPWGPVPRIMLKIAVSMLSVPV